MLHCTEGTARVGKDKCSVNSNDTASYKQETHTMVLELRSLQTGATNWLLFLPHAVSKGARREYCSHTMCCRT